MTRKKHDEPDWAKLFWPSLLADAGFAFTRSMVEAFSPPRPPPSRPEPVWASANRVALHLSAARLRRFDHLTNRGGRTPILVCAPYALHDARIADLAEGHSLMTRLRDAGGPLYLVEWLSARENQIFRGIDDYLADLNIMVDEIGGVCDIVGLCQGGWLGLAFAARFPSKARRLVIAAAPIDTQAADTPFSTLAGATPIETFEELVRLGDGRALGAHAQQFWAMIAHDDEQIHELLQSDLPLDSPEFHERAAMFRAWSESPLDLPGAYFLEVVEKLYKRNQLALGEFVALGKTIDLRAVRLPLYLIAAAGDEVSAPKQTLACARLVGTPPDGIRQAVVPGNHLDLFFGRRTLKELWPDVAAWLAAP